MKLELSEVLKNEVADKPNIANVFFKTGDVESWGRGYKNISDICKVRKEKLMFLNQKGLLSLE